MHVSFNSWAAENNDIISTFRRRTTGKSENRMNIRTELQRIISYNNWPEHFLPSDFEFKI